MTQKELKDNYLVAILENLTLKSKVKLVIDILEEIENELFCNGYYDIHNKINEFIKQLKEWL